MTSPSVALPQLAAHVAAHLTGFAGDSDSRVQSEAPNLLYFWILMTTAVSFIVPLVDGRLPSLSVPDYKRRMHCSEQNGAPMCIGVATVAAIQRTCPSDKQTRPPIKGRPERDNPVDNRQESHMVLPKYWGFGGREHCGRGVGQTSVTFATKLLGVLVDEVDENFDRVGPNRAGEQAE
jgi:hypothetical protein